MSQSSPNQPDETKQRASFMAIGGFVVGASAMAVLFGLHNAVDDERVDSLRGYSSSSAPEIDTSDMNMVNIVVPSNFSETMSTIATNISTSTQAVNSIAPPTQAPSYSPSSDTLRPTSFPTSSETSMPTDLPTSDTTFAPTLEDYDTPDGLKLQPWALRSSEVGFRLKLYWETGYYWQERTDETWWCMGCVDGKCEKGAKLELTNCMKKTGKDATFVVTTHGNKGHQFRVTNTNLCLQKIGDRRAIRLKPCRRNRSLQLFADFEKDDKFDLRPIGYKYRCLSNHHHPKAGESIYAESCTKAHKTTTGYWVAY